MGAAGPLESGPDGSPKRGTIGVTLCCAYSDLALMQRLQPLLREEGIPVELLPGVERETELLMMQLSADEGPTIYAVVNGEGLGEDKLNELVKLFSDERGPAHRLLVLEVDAEDPPAMVDIVVRTRDSMRRHRSSQELPRARGGSGRNTQRGLPMRDPLRDQVGPIPSTIRPARGSEPGRRRTPNQDDDRYAFGMSLPPSDVTPREVIELPEGGDETATRRRVTPLLMPPIVEKRPTADARTDVEAEPKPEPQRNIPDALAGMPIAIEDDATPIPPQLRQPERKPTPRPRQAGRYPSPGSADRPTPADGALTRQLPPSEPRAALPNLVAVPVEPEAWGASPSDAVEEMETTVVRTRTSSRRGLVLLAAAGLVLAAGMAYFVFGPPADENDTSNRVARGAAARGGDDGEAGKTDRPPRDATPTNDAEKPADDDAKRPALPERESEEPEPEPKPEPDDPQPEPEPDADPAPDDGGGADPPTAPATARDQLIEAKRINEALEEGKIHALDALLFFTPIPADLVDWSSANARCRTATVNRIGLWRLPTLKEARKLRGARRLRAGSYWTTTKVGDDGNWVVRSRGKPVTAEKSEQAAAVCVRQRIEG